MKRNEFQFIILLLALACWTDVYSQQPGVLFRDGNSHYKAKKYDEAEISYRKGLEKQADAIAGKYNLSNSLYMQEKYKEAAVYLDSLSKQTKNSKLLSDIYHNLGNTYLKDKEYEKSIEAFKEALRQQPNSEDSRYNLSYAYKMLKQQQEQQKKQEQQKDKKEEKQENKEQQAQEQKKQGIQREEAERILDALERQEKDLRKQEEKKKGQGTVGGKDW